MKRNTIAFWLLRRKSIKQLEREEKQRAIFDMQPQLFLEDK